MGAGVGGRRRRWRSQALCLALGLVLTGAASADWDASRSRDGYRSYSAVAEPEERAEPRREEDPPKRAAVQPAPEGEPSQREERRSSEGE